MISSSATSVALAGARVALVGVGRLGASLGLALSRRGIRVVGFTTRTAPGRTRAAEILSLSPAPDLRSLLQTDPTLLLLTVPDAALPEVVAGLAAALEGGAGSPAPPTVVHTSGATPVAVLDPPARLGCVTLGLHPLQTFADPGGTPESLEGVAFAVTPGPRGGREVGFELATALGGRPFFLAEEDRPLYHAAAVVASNYLVTLEHVAEGLFEAAGRPAGEALEAFLPLVRGAVDNLAARGTVAALTGPLSRGDVETIALHLHTLAERRPADLDLYRTLGLATLDLVSKRSEVSPEVQEQLRTLLRSPAAPAGGGPVPVHADVHADTDAPAVHADVPSQTDARCGNTPQKHSEAQEVPMDTPTTVSGYAASGTMQVITHSFTIPTKGEADIHNITDEVRRLLASTGLDSGTATVFMPGATGSVTTLEFEPGVVHDFQRLFDEVATAARDYQHNVMLGDGNGHSHVRAGLLGPSLVVPFAGSRLILGTWQEICLVDFDNRPRDRKVVVQFMGV